MAFTKLEHALRLVKSEVEQSQRAYDAARRAQEAAMENLLKRGTELALAKERQRVLEAVKRRNQDDEGGGTTSTPV